MLRDLSVRERRSITAIADRFGVSYGAIRYWIRKYDLCDERTISAPLGDVDDRDRSYGPPPERVNPVFEGERVVCTATSNTGSNGGDTYHEWTYTDDGLVAPACAYASPAGTYRFVSLAAVEHASEACQLCFAETVRDNAGRAVVVVSSKGVYHLPVAGADRPTLDPVCRATTTARTSELRPRSAAETEYDLCGECYSVLDPMA